MDVLSEWLMLCTGVALAVVAVSTAVWAVKVTRIVGRPLHRQLVGRRPFLLWVLGLLGTGVLVVFSGLVPTAPALLVLGAAAALLAPLPRAEDSVYGEAGVRCGWFARRFEDLEEWRLTGDHLRWRVGGEWLSSSVPAELQLELRERLERECPDRESRFRH
jgi:hypothetical protein